MAQDSWKQDKEETNCHTPEGPIMCTNNCGFFGSVVTLGMCSKCYQDYILAQASTNNSDNKIVISSDLLVGPRKGLERTQSENSYLEAHLSKEQVEAEGSSSEGGSSASNQDPCRPQVYRCFMCKKRIGLTGFKCRCGNTFCSLHRYSDKHSCTYDYKTSGRDAIAKANPVVKADKVDKI